MNVSPLGQLLLVGIPGPQLDSKTAATLRRVQPGGFILFTRNIETATGLRKLIDDLRDLSAVEPIITIDQEGGRVSRLKAIGNEPPSASQFRACNDVDLIQRHGELTARLLRLFGFNLDLAPVLDLCLHGDETADNSLRGRCYGVDVPQVIRLAGAFNGALRAGGILSCGKHFPGYTAAASDAHHDLPVIDRSRAQLEQLELLPFRHFIHANELDAMMIAHAHYPRLDSSGVPGSLSRKVVHDLSRADLGFQGLIMTDDLDMGAIYNRYGLEEALRLALCAGNDLAMICHRIHALDEARRFLEQLPAAEVDRALGNVGAFKQRVSPPVARFSEEAFRELDRQVWDLRVQTLGPELAAQRSPEDGKRSPVEIY